MNAGISALLVAIAIPALAAPIDAQRPCVWNPAVPGYGPCARQAAPACGTIARPLAARGNRGFQQDLPQGRQRLARPGAARWNGPGAGTPQAAGRGRGFGAGTPQAAGRGRGFGAGAAQGAGRGRGFGAGAAQRAGRGLGAGATQGAGRGRGFGAGAARGAGRGFGAGRAVAGLGPCAQPVVVSEQPPTAEVAAFVERLNDALQKEIDARDYYLAAAHALGSSGPPRFERLAHAEQNHAEAIRRAILLLGGEVVEPESQPCTPPKTLAEAYEGGLDIEQTVIDLYKDLIRDCPDARVQRILENIQAANQRHLGAFGG